MDEAQCTSRHVITQSQDSKPAVTTCPEDSCSTVVFQESVNEHFNAAQQSLAKHLEAAAAFIAKRLEAIDSLENRVTHLQAENSRLQTLAPKPLWSAEQSAEPKSPWEPEQTAENDRLETLAPKPLWSAEKSAEPKSPWAPEQNGSPKSPWSSEQNGAFIGTESSDSSSISAVESRTARREDQATADHKEAQVSHQILLPGERSEPAPASKSERRRISAPASMRGRGGVQLERSLEMQKDVGFEKAHGHGDTNPGDTSPRSLSGANASGFTVAKSIVSSVKSDASSKDDNFVNRMQKRLSISSLDSASTTRSTEEVYEVLPHWIIRSAAKRNTATKVSFGSLSSLNAPDVNSVDGQSQKSEEHQLCLSTIKPHTSKRAFWDVASFALVLYDMTVIPLAFLSPPDFLVFDIMSWATRIFWTLDIVMSCITGYMKPNGNLELRLSKVVKEYLRSWFVLDLFIVTLDWTELFWSGSNNAGYARLGKASRVFRVVRMLRLLRILRARKLMLIITARIQSERLIIMAHMVQLMIILVGWSHLSACIWYGIGRSDPGSNWVDQFFTESQEDSFGYRYFSSLHWALCQFTGGMDEIRPTNTSERIFNIVMFLLAFVMAAVFVSHLTSSMTQLTMMSQQQLLHLAALRRFLLENGISDLLSRRIQHSAQHAMREQQRLTPEANVELLKSVSGTLRVDLHFELYSPFLEKHRFFARYMQEFPHVVRRICHEAMTIEEYTKGDDVFADGELPTDPKMLAVHSGKFAYDRTLEFPEYVEEPGTWICEAVMWTRWRHKGTLTAAAHHCRLCALWATKFHQIVRQFKYNGYGPREYANNFVQELNQKGLDGTPASDLPFEVSLPVLAVKSTSSRKESLPKVMPWLKDSAMTPLDTDASKDFNGLMR